MSWNPNQGQDPNQPGQYGGYGGYPPQNPPQQPTNPTDPYSGQQGGYQQPPQYDPNSGGYQQGGYQQPGTGYNQQQQYQQYQAPYGAQGAAGAGASALGPTSMGMDAKTASGLSYILGWITGVIFFFTEKTNNFVRFNAMQSILFFGGLTVLDIILRIASGFTPGFLSLIFACALGLLGLVGFVGWIVLMINGFQGKYFKLPIVGDYAERYVNTGKFQ